jgi:hypothetical protein
MEQLILEKEHEPSTLQGDTMLTALTSFEGDSSKHSPIPLTCDIVRNARKWINTNCNFEPEDATLSDLVSCYLIELGNSIPKSLVFHELKKFVTDHNWDDTPAEELTKIKALDPNTSDEHESALKVWNFIQVQLAWNTKIVGQVLDCQHRVIALSRVLLGQYDLPSVTQSMQTAVYSKFSNRNILVTFIIPKQQKLDQDVDSKMKTFSALRQHSASKQVPLGPKDVLSLLMSALEVKCKEQNVNYLCCEEFGMVLKMYHGRNFTNERSFRKVTNSLAGTKIFQSFSDANNYLSETMLTRPNLAPVVYVQCWIEVMSTLIKDVFFNSGVKNLLVSDSDSVSVEENWNIYFQPMHKGKGKQIFKYLFGTKNYTLHHFMKKNKSIYDPQRYPGVPDSRVLEIVQWLLWFRVSDKTQSTLQEFVTKNGSQDFSKLLSCTVHSITAAVYYSSFLLEKAINKSGRKRIDYLDQQVLYFFLLMSAIEQNMPFFCEAGSNPKKTPLWYQSVKKAIKIQNLQDSEDFLSILTILHVCHLNVHCEDAQYLPANVQCENLRGSQDMQYLLGNVVIVNDPKVRNGIVTASITSYLQHPFLDMDKVIREVNKNHFSRYVPAFTPSESEEEGDEESGEEEEDEVEEEEEEEEVEDEDEEDEDEETEDNDDEETEKDEEVSIQPQVPSSLIDSLKDLDLYLQQEDLKNLLRCLDASADSVIESLKSIVTNMQGASALGDHNYP